MHLDLTAAELRRRLDYDLATGVFRWRHDPNQRANWNTRWAGKVAGNLTPDGRMVIRVGYTKYFASRLAWLYVTGEWPSAEIDHQDCDHGNNRFSNLRPATRRENMRNTRLQRRSTSGFKGVSFNKERQRWVATIKGADGRYRYLGRFTAKEEAAAAYAEAAKSIAGEFARVA